MTERPILFSSAMVRALLARTKTQTRRVVKHRHDWYMDERADGAPWPFVRDYVHGEPDPVEVACPYGASGDTLWVRESFAPRYFDNGAPGYMADWTEVAAAYVPKPKWKPSIHMPRALSRITLRVISVRVERVQDISEEDARAEGACELPLQEGAPGAWWRVPGTGMGPHRSARAAFKALWESINGAESWDANPWVWCVGFERVEVSHG